MSTDVTLNYNSDLAETSSAPDAPSARTKKIIAMMAVPTTECPAFTPK